jgi:formyltetrahydrofolate deformylase
VTEHVLTLSCPDRPGIVAAVAGLLADHGGNIVESQQYGDPVTGRFFMRVQFTLPAAAPSGPAAPPSGAAATPYGAAATPYGAAAAPSGPAAAPSAGPPIETGPAAALRSSLAVLAAELHLQWELYDTAVRPRVLILVSRAGHCLNDLLYRQRSGLGIDIVAVVSNHPDLRPLTQTHGIDYHHLPVTDENRASQEAEILTLVTHYRADFVVLARYMQVLTDGLCGKLQGRAINIHHSFLPGFKGSRPYQQAHARGVKLIGATAHYVTSELDEGPIIEQEVARVDHSQGPAALMAVGRDLECLALARAVRWHAEHRVLLNGAKTVVFR